MPHSDTATAPLEWPNLSTVEYLELWIYPALTLVFFIIVLNLIPPYIFKKKKKVDTENPTEATELLSKTEPVEEEEHVMIAGERTDAENYTEVWTETFDLTFLLFMVAVFIALSLATTFYKPELWTNTTFWLYQLPKPGVMMGVSVLMGLLCRQYCDVDERGYLDTREGSKFRVNYTRKVQHFCAYFIPLVITMPDYCNCTGTLETVWGQWMTLMCFCIMIKPLREMPYIGTFFMLQFNSLDRTEDRPNTLKWIVAYNIIPGCVLILFFRWLYAPLGQSELALIFVFVTGIGDGLAEPVGIYFYQQGTSHQYKVRSCTDATKYVRSYEGSVCVWLSGNIFTAMMYQSFKTSTSFWLCFWLMGPCMAIAEATSPHTMDTPFLMGLGGFIIYGCIMFF